MTRFSRRRLLLGGAAAVPALAALHEAVPHGGLHEAIEGASAADSAHGDGAGAAHGEFGPDFRGGDVDHLANGFNPTEVLRDFDRGRARRLASGRVLREWEIVAIDKEIEVAPGVKFSAWTYNGRVPAPTLRAHEGERLRIRFMNASEHAHTIHFHGIHTATMDGVPGVGEGGGGGLIGPGESFTYEFVAEPFGLHQYHCHSSPLATHIHKGLYGAFIVDPKQGRPEADELVMVMNGFDTNFDQSNEVYAVNTVGFHYLREPIRVRRGELVRIYLVNMLEFDPINSFHIHANFFHYYPTGTSLEPADFTDTIVVGQAQRGILELRFPFPGKYMFHAHKTEFAELGWMGFFEVHG
jgi:FtsP/CotA-like multicopper oxidase with cupredoxin domain